MSLESDLAVTLATCCPRVFTPVAKVGTVTPYLTWQHVGGMTMRFLDQTAADKRNARIQVNAWAASMSQAVLLIRAVEDALCAAMPQLIVTPQGEPIAAFSEDKDIYGAMQDFSIWGSRT